MARSLIATVSTHGPRPLTILIASWAHDIALSHTRIRISSRDAEIGAAGCAVRELGMQFLGTVIIGFRTTSTFLLERSADIEPANQGIVRARTDPFEIFTITRGHLVGSPLAPRFFLAAGGESTPGPFV
jgi:hypothetical protein